MKHLDTHNQPAYELEDDELYRAHILGQQRIHKPSATNNNEIVSWQPTYAPDTLTADASVICGLIGEMAYAYHYNAWFDIRQFTEGEGDGDVDLVVGGLKLSIKSTSNSDGNLLLYDLPHHADYVALAIVDYGCVTNMIDVHGRSSAWLAGVISTERLREQYGKKIKMPRGLRHLIKRKDLDHPDVIFARQHDYPAIPPYIRWKTLKNDKTIYIDSEYCRDEIDMQVGSWRELSQVWRADSIPIWRYKYMNGTNDTRKAYALNMLKSVLLDADTILSDETLGYPVTSHRR